MRIRNPLRIPLDPYYAAPCDNGPDAPKARTWLVIDRRRGAAVADLPTRQAARDRATIYSWWATAIEGLGRAVARAARLR